MRECLWLNGGHEVVRKRMQWLMRGMASRHASPC